LTWIHRNVRVDSSLCSRVDDVAGCWRLQSWLDRLRCRWCCLQVTILLQCQCIKVVSFLTGTPHGWQDHWRGSRQLRESRIKSGVCLGRPGISSGSHPHDAIREQIQGVSTVENAPYVWVHVSHGDFLHATWASWSARKCDSHQRQGYVGRRQHQSPFLWWRLFPLQDCFNKGYGRSRKPANHPVHRSPFQVNSGMHLNTHARNASFHC